MATAFSGVNRLLELFSHFKLQYLAVSLLLLVLCLTFSYKRYALLMLGCAALNAFYILPWYLPPPQATADGETFKLLLANVHAENRQHERIVALLRDEQADIVLLLEVGYDWEETLSTLDDYPHQELLARRDYFGIALISKFPFVALEVIDSPPLDLPTIVAQLSVNGETLTLIGTHPVPPLGRENFNARNTQLASISRLLNKHGGARVLSGDLNTAMWGRHYQALARDSGLQNVRAGFGVLPSWPTFMPIAMIPIDHCLISEELTAVDVRTGPDIGSDHLPLIATLRLQPQDRNQDSVTASARLPVH